MIRFDNVSKTYDGQTFVVNSLNFQIQQGEFFVLIGPSGSGKTTTLKMINRLHSLTEGTIWIQDRKISDYNIHELRWRIGYVLQQIALFPHMTIEENIAIVPELIGWDKLRVHQRVTELLTMVGLDAETFRRRKPHELSGGQQQRIGVARALAADPEIVLMDEPFSALDPISRLKLQDDLLELQRTIRKTIVFVTHDLSEAFKLGDRICIIKDGQVEQLGAPEDILANPATSFVEDFIGQLRKRSFPVLDRLEPLTGEHWPSLPLNADWDELMQALAQTERVAIEQEGQLLGTIARQTVIQFLAEQGGNHSG